MQTIYNDYQALRSHLRRDHKIKKVDDSNKYRYDGGYYRYDQQTHYFPGDRGFEARRAVGYGVKKVNHQRQPTPAPSTSAAAGGINITPAELTAMLESVTDSIQRGVAAGISQTLRHASAIASMMDTNQTTARRISPVAGSNNVMVSISNVSRPGKCSVKLSKVYEKMPTMFH